MFRCILMHTHFKKKKKDREVRCVLISSLNTAYTSDCKFKKKPGCDVASESISIKNWYLIHVQHWTTIEDSFSSHDFSVDCCLNLCSGYLR